MEPFNWSLVQDKPLSHEMDNNATPGRVNLRGQRTCWLFTVNNPHAHGYTNDSMVKLLTDDERIRYFVFQVEKGELGTVHYQGKSRGFFLQNMTKYDKI